MWWKSGGKEGVMLSPSFLVKLAIGFYNYMWVDVLLIKETQKAILVMFDGRKIWFPKAWIVRIKRNHHCEEQSDKAISLKISEYHWAKKFN